MDNLLIVIPAIKKNAVIPDQLIKKLDGITLIQRAINTALDIVNNKNILIITDSQEISLISERNDIEYYLDSSLKLNSGNILELTLDITKKFSHTNILLYRANTPLVGSDILLNAYNEFKKDINYMLVSIKINEKKLLKLNNGFLHRVDDGIYFNELKSFYIFNRYNLDIKKSKPFIIKQEKSIEILSYQDWWVCEKILKRKKIVFNVIGNIEIGMGHIYHSLALAHEITDHEIIFVCDEKYKIAVDKLASSDYKVISTPDILNTIIQIKPNLVINDILNTEYEYIKCLKNCGIKVVNFEDLGKGSRYADIVFNELYDKPIFDDKNFRWGYNYLALRDEFYEAVPHNILEDIKEVLITFGGADQNNLTLITLKSIISKCKKLSIKINIVCGEAYRFKNELHDYISRVGYKNIYLTYASEVISKIMEKSQLAISSNGRTVYELADMNIPSIIISHHKRESTHSFASPEKGFINLGVINEGIDKKIKDKFDKLVDDVDYRKLLFLNIKEYNFRDNKQKVVKEILSLI
ncbi:PseG family hydrolase [Campylobacter iguaniorum]|uniref:hypothetical protein n=1 Tax=Campylobacter iguaniorum TaxID=1244531 RepID=UPI00073A3AD0|nr:hypothetical protein [Campylobacter iguaniorum]ALV23648.1 PseG family hydrolase [Campylobacter iguaniorum]